MQRIDATEAAEELLRRARAEAPVDSEAYDDAVDGLLHDAEVDSWADASRGFEGARAALELREAVERLR